MPKSAASTDVFAAIAEPRRREIVELLASAGPSPVNAIVEALDAPQPSISKHLAVLSEAGVVAVERSGRQRIYRLQVRELQAMHAWIHQFETLWSNNLSRVKARAERLASERDATTRVSRSARKDNP